MSSKPLDVVIRIAELESGWFLLTEGVPGGEHVVGPFDNEACARAAQKDVADMLAQQLGAPPPTAGHPKRGRS
jgi:hypothetical protein